MDKIEIGLLVIALLIVVLGVWRVIKNRSDAKGEAKKFLDELSEQMYLIAIEIINDIDINNFKNFDEYKKVILEKVYEGCWDFVEKKLAEYEGRDMLSAVAKKLITKEYVEKFIDNLLIERDIPETMMNVYGANEIAKMDTEEDQEIEKEFADQTKYVENSEEVELPPAEEKEVPEEEAAKLNPQKDEDAEEYSDDDSSVEEVSDYITKITNKAGKIMYYLVNAEGKRKQVSKDYAESSGLEIK